MKVQRQPVASKMSTSMANPLENEGVNIRLRRLNSTASSTYSNTTLPPYSSSTSLTPLTNPFLSPDDASDISCPSYTALSPFVPTSSLQIEAEGKKSISLPSPPKQLEIPIFSVGEKARPVYLSIRAKRGSGSCRLVTVDDGAETEVASTTYFFGPGHPPQVRINGPSEDEADEFTVVCKSLLSRTTNFESRWGKFEWRYASRSERNEFSTPPPNNILLLSKLSTIFTPEGEKEERVVVARLVRSEELRAAGTKASSWGNGGRLEMCLEAGEGPVIDEVTVLVTCLVMLKKEIDRLRGIQIMVLSGGASG